MKSENKGKLLKIHKMISQITTRKGGIEVCPESVIKGILVNWINNVNTFADTDTFDIHIEMNVKDFYNCSDIKGKLLCD